MMVRHLLSEESCRLLRKLFDNQSDHDGYVAILRSNKMFNLLNNLRLLLIKDYSLGDRIIVFVIDNEVLNPRSTSGYELKAFRKVIKNGGVLFHRGLLEICPSYHKAYEVRDSLIEAGLILKLELVNNRDRIFYIINPEFVKRVKKG